MDPNNPALLVLTSLTLETKVLSRGLLFSVLGSLGTTFILNLIVTYYIALENPEIMKDVENKVRENFEQAFEKSLGDEVEETDD